MESEINFSFGCVLPHSKTTVNYVGDILSPITILTQQIRQSIS